MSSINLGSLSLSETVCAISIRGTLINNRSSRDKRRFSSGFVVGLAVLFAICICGHVSVRIQKLCNKEIFW